MWRCDSSVVLFMSRSDTFVWLNTSLIRCKESGAVFGRAELWADDKIAK